MKGLSITPINASLLLLFTFIVAGIVAFSGTAAAGPTLIGCPPDGPCFADVMPSQNGMLLPPGDLDPTFDGDGKVTTDFLIGAGGSFNDARGVAIQPDGKIVTAGTVRLNATKDNFGLTRYNPDGSLDTSFSGDGRLTTEFFLNDSDAGAYSVAIQSDGKIVAAGTASAELSFGPYYNFAIARYNPNGTLDTGFDGDGRATIYLSDFADPATNVANAVALQLDGKIVLAGYTTQRGVTNFSMTRLNPDGSLDTSFDGDGRVTTDFFGGVDAAYAVAIQDDGKIVAAGSAQVSGFNYDHALARYNPNGTLDNSFDGDGKLTTDFFGQDDGVNAMAIQADGRILTAGSFRTTGTDYDFGLARYLYNGTLDTSFDNDGLTSFNFAPGVVEDIANGVAIQPDGRIVVAGYAQGVGQDFALARLNSNGSLDNSFSGDGMLTTDFANANDIAYAVALQADGKIVAAGTGYMGGYNLEDFALARYLSSDPPAPTPTNVPAVPTNTAVPGSTPTVCPVQFSDVPAGSTFYDYVRCLACRQIVSGYSDGTFRPSNLVTRGQLAKIVSNSAGYIEPSSNETFEDVPVGSTFHLFIERLSSRGYISGYACGSAGEPCVAPGNRPYFRPNNQVTRGQTAKIVASAAALPAPPSGLWTFEDVPQGSTFWQWIESLSSSGAITGYPCGGAGEPCLPPGNRYYFRPVSNVTRGQSAKIVSYTFFPGCNTPDGTTK